MDNPFVTRNGKLQTLVHHNGEEFRMPDAPFDAGEPTPDHPAPELGQHTDDLLAGIGYDADRIAGLKRKGVV